MKKIVLMLFSAFLITAVSTSCKKSDTSSPNDPEQTMSSIKVSNTFNWSTGAVYEFKVVGSATGTPVKSVLTLSETNGATVYQCLHSSDQPLSIKVILPRSSQKLVVKYGGNSYDVSIIAGVATFNVPTAFAKISGSNGGNLKGVMADGDGDGVEDGLDAYPTDPLRAFNYFYPSSGMGTLAFEDLWPAYGDFDFNDVVVDYKMQTVANGANQVVEIIGHFDLAASGAKFHNGFGFQLDGVVPEKVTRVRGNRITEKPDNGITYAFASNGLESGQTYAVNIVFNSFRKAMGVYRNINTIVDESYVPHYSIIDTTVFILNGVIPAAGGALLSADFNPTKFNFFIVSEKKTGAYEVILIPGTPNDTVWTTVQDRGREIHLGGYHPTNLVDEDYFMTYADSTTGSNYYKTADGLPWGINVLEGFEYPVEKCPVGKKKIGGPEAYINFIPWAVSGGVLHGDWHKRNAVVSGNRNDVNIYAKYLPAPGY